MSKVGNRLDLIHVQIATIDDRLKRIENFLRCIVNGHDMIPSKIKFNLSGPDKEMRYYIVNVCSNCGKKEYEAISKEEMDVIRKCIYIPFAGEKNETNCSMQWM